MSSRRLRQGYAPIKLNFIEEPIVSVPAIVPLNGTPTPKSPVELDQFPEYRSAESASSRIRLRPVSVEYLLGVTVM